MGYPELPRSGGPRRHAGRASDFLLAYRNLDGAASHWWNHVHRWSYLPDDGVDVSDDSGSDTNVVMISGPCAICGTRIVGEYKELVGGFKAHQECFDEINQMAEEMIQKSEKALSEARAIMRRSTFHVVEDE